MNDDFNDIDGLLSDSKNILNDDDERPAAEPDPAECLRDQETLEEESFFSIIATSRFKIHFRIHEKFVNHLYSSYSGGDADFIFAYNSKSGACTFSCDAPEKLGINCEKIMKSVFGEKAGGREGIAKSPRGVFFSKEKFFESGWKVVNEIGKYRKI